MLGRRKTPLFIVAAVLSAVIAAPTMAQRAPYDPPARVGRLARISGTVTYHTAGADHWEPAPLNYPITSGISLWTEPGASAEVEVERDRFVSGEQTELDIDTIDDHAIAVTTAQGEAYIQLRDMARGDTVTVRTPRGLVTLTQPGRYEIAAGDPEHATLVTVVDGAAQVSGDTTPPLTVDSGQTARLVGTDTFSVSIGPEQVDPFLHIQIAEAPSPPEVVSPRPDITQMTGADDLASVGEWAPTPDYGEVWYPPVDPSWVPYRDGNWAYVAPWGWTWVDAEPWGFAPFHYGRWVEIGPRWAWCPDRDEHHERPIFAPALVRWMHFRSVREAVNDFRRPVGWVPLGPRERFVPWYRSSQAYVRNINRANVTNVVKIESLANRRGATVAPADAVISSQRIASHMHADSNAMLDGARADFAPRVRPTLVTAGVTPALARQIRMPPPPPGATPRPAGPGPGFQPGLVAARGSRPELRAATGEPEQHGLPPVAAQGAEMPGRGPGVTTLQGATAGAAVGLVGAGLLNHGRPSVPGHAALPPLVNPHSGGPATQSAVGAPVGAAPGPAIMPRNAAQGAPPAGPPRDQVSRPTKAEGAPHLPPPAQVQTAPPLRAQVPPSSPPTRSEPPPHVQTFVPTTAPSSHHEPSPPPQVHVMEAPRPQAQPPAQTQPRVHEPSPPPQVHVMEAPRPQFRPPPQPRFQPPPAHIQAFSPPAPRFQAPPPRPSAPPPQAHRNCPPGRSC